MQFEGLEGKVAIVTGSAGGIGQATVNRLAREGCRVVVTDILADRINDIVGELKKSGHEAIAIKVDVTDSDEIREMVQSTLDKFGQIDILANIAGAPIQAGLGPFSESKKEFWDKNINLNLYGTLNCCRAVINHMIERRCGKIINVASVTGMIGRTKMADYAAAKAGVIAFTKSLALEVGEYGVRVNCVSPSLIVSPRLLSLPEERRREIVKTIPLGSLGSPEAVANVIVFLASDEPYFVTGANFVVDGGHTLGHY